MRRTPLAKSAACLSAVAAAAGAIALASGCQKQLFPANTPKTQFERYDTLRSGATPAEEPDVFGRPQPALRARLTPTQP